MTETCETVTIPDAFGHDPGPLGLSQPTFQRLCLLYWGQGSDVLDRTYSGRGRVADLLDIDRRCALRMRRAEIESDARELQASRDAWDEVRDAFIKHHEEEREQLVSALAYERAGAESLSKTCHAIHSRADRLGRQLDSISRALADESEETRDRVWKAASGYLGANARKV